jgi:Putative DNA-binding domain
VLSGVAAARTERVSSRPRAPGAGACFHAPTLAEPVASALAADYSPWQMQLRRTFDARGQVVPGWVTPRLWHDWPTGNPRRLCVRCDATPRRLSAAPRGTLSRVSIDSKPPSAWDEGDLEDVCSERRRETQTLEFKGELHLDTDGQKRDVEHDALGMATGGGGVIIYGIAEAVLADGARTADRLAPLRDGTLRDRLQDVLDSRGQPRLPFELHEVRMARGGFVLILEVFGRRRPHQAQDGRYYDRRGTNVRQMTEAELAEAYRDRFLRDVRALEALTQAQDVSGLTADVEARIHRGLKPNELALWREETGELEPPGWMTAVVLPMPAQPGLLEPVRDARLFHTSIDFDERWDSDNAPLQYFRLRPAGDRLFDQLPSRDDAAPGYLVSMYRDGVMEYGTTLEPALRDENPERNRVLFSGSHPQQAHDYLLAFAIALRRLGYEGPVAAQVSFEHTRGTRILVGPRRGAGMHAIEEEHIRGQVWRGERSSLLQNAGLIVKDVADRVFWAAGAEDGCWFIDEQGHLLRDRE